MIRHAIIPPDLLERIASSPTVTLAARQAAARTLLMTRRLADAREAPVEPEAGETRTVSDAQHGTGLPGTRVRGENDPPTGDEEVDRAYDGSGLVYAHYYTQHHRRSLDDLGLPLLSTVHYDRRFNNAFWDGSQMVYGDGDGIIFRPFTRSLDVIGHELTHGVVQNTAGLRYQGQSGALNEHVADVFGVRVRQLALGLSVEAPNAWLVGADLWMPGVQARGLRDMLHPGTAYDDPVLGRDPQPAHMDDYIDTLEDNGGVHLNSGIPNRAFALCALAIGPAAAEDVWYTAMLRASARTTFAQFADLTRAVAAPTLVGDIETAWQTVGIEPDGAPAPPDPSPCERELRALLADAKARLAVGTLLGHPVVRRLLARARRIASE